MRYRVVLFAALAMAVTGCSTGQFARVNDTDAAGYAAPGPDLVGTWRGTVFTVGGSNYLISTPVTLTIKPDGSWTWGNAAGELGRGHIGVRADRVVLAEEWSKKGSTQGTNAAAETIQLRRRGNELWGVTRAFIPGGENAVQLEKVIS